MLVALLPGGSAAAASARNAEDTGRYLVLLDDSVRMQVSDVVQDHHERYGVQAGFTYEHALLGYSAVIPNSLVAQLRNDPRVAMVAVDRPVRAVQQALPTGIDRVEGDQSSTRSGDGSGSVSTGVAIIDTGIDMNHRDLNVVGGVNCTIPGLPPALQPFFPPQDDNGHGTHVAGTVAAKDNDSDVVGVAPGARLFSVKVLNALGTGLTSNVVCGLDWVAQNAQRNGIKVANMSLGGSGSDDGNCGANDDDAMHAAICRLVNQAGVTVTVAAGNDTDDLAGFTPAAYNEVLTATAVADFNGRPGGGAAATCRSDEDDTAAEFSNFATLGEDARHTIAAPGVCILSTRLGGGTTVLSGTSMASPHVAGTAALCLAGPCAGMTPAQVISRLRADAAAQPAGYGFAGDPNSPVGNRYYGHLEHAGTY